MAIYNGGLNIVAQDISGKEDKSNKVATWSSTTTDVHYPSEKLVKSALDAKVNTADVLTLEEIQATTDLTGKVAGAKALGDTLSISRYHNEGEHVTIKIPPNFVIILAADGSDNCYFGMVAGYTIETIVSKGYTSANIAINAERGEVTLPASGWYRYMIIK